MASRNVILLFIAVLIVSGFSTAAEIAVASGVSGQPLSGSARALLYDQTDGAAGNGAPDQDFELAYDAYDSEGADDFVVPAGDVAWDIEEVATVGTTVTPGGATVDVLFYPDAAGMPGVTAVCSYADIVPVDNLGSLTITLPTVCHLTAGTYWVAIQVNQEYVTYGQHFWSNRSVQSNNESVWRNPGGGFGTPCNDWGRQATVCGVGGGIGPDFLFQILGTIVPVELQSLSVE